MSQITKLALVQALKNLLSVKPLNKITISDITNECGINRMTFYYHFQDIYDLAEWACIQEMDKVLQQNKTHDTWQEGVLHIFYAVQENKQLISNVYRCVDREKVESFLKPVIVNLLLNVVNEQAKNMNVNDEDKEFIAELYSYAFVGLMLDWIKTDMRADPQLFVNKLAIAMHNTFVEALEKFELSN